MTTKTKEDIMIVTRFGDFESWEEYARYLDEKCKASEAEIESLNKELQGLAWLAVKCRCEVFN